LSPGSGSSKGRGAASNPLPRHAHWQRQPYDDGWESRDAAAPPLRTTVTTLASRSVIARNDSPDVPFDRSVNPYRGCEHGCIYCYARPTHAYLDHSPGLDFESRLYAKPDAPALLERELRRRGYACAPLALGTNTDPYQPIERHYGVTRGLIEVLARCGHPLSIVTKSALVERDLDLLADMACRNLVEVWISITTLDRALARRLEPRAAAPQRRLRTIETLREAGVPVGVLVAPVIPGLTDSELEDIVAAAVAAGADTAGYVLLRLPGEVAALFSDWLQIHYPLHARRVLGLLRQMHGARGYDGGFGRRMSGRGPLAELLARRFELACGRLGLGDGRRSLDCGQFRSPGLPAEQLDLFS
jgi:DNA repair photolyase